MKNLKGIMAGVAALAITIFMIWGCYWVVKSVSYNLFYEDMVIQTIQEQVKKEALNR